jgi:acyl carrier protein
MGLEWLELVMKIEDAFNIKIDDEASGSLHTVGQLTDLVLNKIGPVSTDPNSFQKAFGLLREAILAEFPGTCHITTETPTETVFPARSRKYWWNRIAQKAGVKFPEITIAPKLLRTTKSLFWLSILMLIGGLVWLESVPYAYWIVLLSLWVGLFLWILLLKPASVFYPGIFPIPPSCRTLGDLAKAILAHNPTRFQPLDKDAVFASLAFIIAEQFDVPLETIKPETRFIEDLRF